MAQWMKILEPGTYKGFPIDRSFLEEVVDTFGKAVRPMLRRGHRPTPGAPAAGQVPNVRLNGTVLEAKIEPTPEFLSDVKLGRFASLSAGFSRRVINGTKRWCLDHIAALGEEHPEYKGQSALAFNELEFSDPILDLGEGLASELNRLIDESASEDRSRADIVAAMGRAAGIDAGTVNQILEGSINCPPIERLRGFAKVLDVSVDTLIRAARGDGCSYNTGDTEMNEKNLKDALKELKESLLSGIKDLWPQAGSRKDTVEQLTADELKAAEERLSRQFDEKLKAVEEKLKLTESEAARLRAESRRKENEAFIDKGIKEFRIPPALKEAGVLELMETLSDDDVIELKEGDETKKISQLELFKRVLSSYPGLELGQEFVTRKNLDEHAGTAISDDRRRTILRAMNLSEEEIEKEIKKTHA